MTMKKRKKEKTIFRTILFAMLLVLGIEIVLLVSALYLSNVSTRLNQNAMDLLDMQTSNRADYLENILLFNQDLSRLSSYINEKASELSAAQKLDLSRIGDSSTEALPLLEEISTAMISTLRSKSVTGVFVAFTTEDFSKSSTVSAIPGMYLRDLDPTSPASAANEDLLLERSPIALVRSMGISTDKSWTTSFDLTQKPESAFLTPVFLATWADRGALDADNYGRWTVFCPTRFPGMTVLPLPTQFRLSHPTVPFTALSVSRCLSPICSRFFPIPSCRTKAMERIFSFPRLPLH